MGLSLEPEVDVLVLGVAFDFLEAFFPPEAAHHAERIPPGEVDGVVLGDRQGLPAELER